MIDWFLDPFQYAFMQRALLGGALAAAICAGAYWRIQTAASSIPSGIPRRVRQTWQMARRSAGAGW